MQFSEGSIKALIELFDDSDLVALHVRTDEGELTLSRETGLGAEPTSPAVARVEDSADAQVSSSSGSVPVTTTQQAAVTNGAETTETPGDTLVTVTAPTLGAFYHSPRPDQPPYVKVGAHVDPDTTVGLIEAMKVYTAVTAGVSGTVREIVVPNNDFVEFGQILMTVEPDTAGGAGH